MSTSTVTSTGDLSGVWMADQFAEIEKKDMRVTEVRMRTFPAHLNHDVDVVRGKRYFWRALVVEDRRMRKGVVTFRYERYEGSKPVVRTYSRSRTIR